LYNGSQSVSIEFEILLVEILPDVLPNSDRSSSSIKRRQIENLPFLSVLVPYVITVQLLDNDTSLENIAQDFQNIFNASGEIVGFSAVGMPTILLNCFFIYTSRYL